MVNKALITAQLIDFLLAGLYGSYNREHTFNEARKTADKLNRPLVNYGCRNTEPFVSESDLNLDIEPRNVPHFELIPPDGRIPLPDNSAVVYASHVLEHVNNLDKVLTDMTRVGPTFIVLPPWWSLGNWINPMHRRVIVGDYAVEEPAAFALPLFIGLNLLNLSS
ncbi:unnamed protein product [marine sediment metagenome]|uniref:Methyltransferase type 11 domain-containing protein n=1 Tax=marine sediment metagenome TaxID=412755 RepID=X1BLM1_9ZZZZ